MGTHHQSKEQATRHTQKMESSMLNITYRDRKLNIWVSGKTKVMDVIVQVRRRKWTWAGHVNRIRYSRWILRIITWKASETVERRTRRLLGMCIWHSIVQDRQMWKQHAEAFAQPRDTGRSVFYFSTSISSLPYSELCMAFRCFCIFPIKPRSSRLLLSVQISNYALYIQSTFSCSSWNDIRSIP